MSSPPASPPQLFTLFSKPLVFPASLARARVGRSLLRSGNPHGLPLASVPELAETPPLLNAAPKLDEAQVLPLLSVVEPLETPLLETQLLIAPELVETQPSQAPPLPQPLAPPLPPLPLPDVSPPQLSVIPPSLLQRDGSFVPLLPVPARPRAGARGGAAAPVRVARAPVPQRVRPSIRQALVLGGVPRSSISTVVLAMAGINDMRYASRAQYLPRHVRRLMSTSARQFPRSATALARYLTLGVGNEDSAVGRATAYVIRARAEVAKYVELGWRTRRQQAHAQFGTLQDLTLLPVSLQAPPAPAPQQVLPAPSPALPVQDVAAPLEVEPEPFEELRLLRMLEASRRRASAVEDKRVSDEARVLRQAQYAEDELVRRDSARMVREAESALVNGRLVAAQLLREAEQKQAQHAASQAAAFALVFQYLPVLFSLLGSARQCNHAASQPAAPQFVYGVNGYIAPQALQPVGYPGHGYPAAQYAYGHAVAQPGYGHAAAQTMAQPGYYGHGYAAAQPVSQPGYYGHGYATAQRAGVSHPAVLQPASGPYTAATAALAAAPAAVLAAAAPAAAAAVHAAIAFAAPAAAAAAFVAPAVSAAAFAAPAAAAAAAAAPEPAAGQQ